MAANLRTNWLIAIIVIGWLMYLLAPACPVSWIAS